MTTEPTGRRDKQDLIQELKQLQIAVSNKNTPVPPERAEFFLQKMERLAVQLKIYLDNPDGSLEKIDLTAIQTALGLIGEIKQNIQRNVLRL